ncbi:MAG: dephospho-CoA kinase [Trueperaceae bacterium]
MASSGTISGSERHADHVSRVGLTGNIGSGKSTVARLLTERGAAVIDSDALARQASEDPTVLQLISAEFGERMVTDGRLDRSVMAQLVFADAEARRRLEGIIHPWVRARSRSLQRRLIESPEPPPVIVHDIPLLFENGLDRSFDSVIVVRAPTETRIARSLASGRLSESDFRARDQAQWPAERKAAAADHLLDNSGDLASLKAQVAELWPKIVTS